MKLLLGDCLYKLKELEDNSVDSIVTDPPYGLSAAPNSGKTSKGGFMGKTWDYDVPSQEIWEECIRVLKPGGHLLAFAGSRTYHRMAVRIEDAGFEIRDQIMWVYGSGFPKSLNLGKSLESKLVNGSSRYSGKKMETKDELGIPGSQWKEAGDRTMSDGENAWSGKSVKVQNPIAKQWNGWGTALKPAHEPIVMARKPLSEKTVVDNVLEWGTGGINIDESRISTDEDQRRPSKGGENGLNNTNTFKIRERTIEEQPKHDGRFPANIIFDEEAGKLLDEQSGLDRGQKGVVSGNEPSHTKKNAIYGDYSMVAGKYAEPKDSGGGASRFFYCPKTSKKDRNEGLDGFEEKQQDLSRKEGNPGGDNPRNRGVNKRKNHHPTVKPTDLMLYLIRLVTPKGGTTLDPFMGSGSTGKGAVRGGFNFIGIEMEEEYFQIATARIQYEKDNPYNEERGERIEINKNSQKFW